MNEIDLHKPQRAPYPLQYFPVIIRESSYEVVNYMGVSDALVGMSFINAVSMACQGLIDVKMPTGQVRPVQQNTLLVLESGERKTTVYNAVLKPFMDADIKAINIFRKRRNEYKTEMELWNTKKKRFHRAISKAASKGESTTEQEAELYMHMKREPKKPRLRYFMRQDITSKAIMEALQGEGESVAISTDEGHVLFKSAAMSHFGLLNRLWDSPEVLPLDRAGYEQIMVMNPRTSIIIMTQFGPLKHYLENRGSVASGSGHWARYLVARPHSTQGFRPVLQCEPTWSHLPRFHTRVAELLEKYRTMIESGKVKRELVTFSDDAKARWFELATQAEGMLRPGEYLSDIKDFAAKIMEIIARLAAALHYFSEQHGDITLDTLERAFKLVEWHIEEYKYMFSPQYVMPQDQVDARKLAMWMRHSVWLGAFSDTVVPRNYVLRNGPIRNGNRLEAALDLLASRGGVQIGSSQNPKDKRRYVRLMNQFFMSLVV